MPAGGNGPEFDGPVIIAEPSADRGPRRGSLAGVVDAPDPKGEIAMSMNYELCVLLSI
jgi:hypothetical protein